MNTPILLALSGDDAEILRALNTPGTGLTVVRRCADLAELLAAGIAGLGTIAVVDADFDLIDRGDIGRLNRAGITTLMLCTESEENNWQRSGCQTALRQQPPAKICALVQQLDKSRSDTASTQRNTASESVIAAPENTAPAPATVRVHEPHGTVQPHGRIIALWGPPGAPGRSTLAAALAHAFSIQSPTILVDADLEAPCQVQMLGVMENASGLASAARLANHCRLDVESLQQLLTKVHTNLGLLSGMGRSGRWRELSPAAMTQVWEVCRRTANWTVVDLAAGIETDQLDEFSLEPGRFAMASELLEQADAVVIVGSGDPVGIHRLVHLLTDLPTLLTLSGRKYVVVNRVRSSAAGPGTEQAIRQALSRFGAVEDLTLIPDDQPLLDRCLLEGRTVYESAPGSAVAKALSALVTELNPEVGAQVKQLRPGLWQRLRKRGDNRHEEKSTGTEAKLDYGVQKGQAANSNTPSSARPARRHRR